MSVCVGVLTGKGYSAIGSLGLVGDSAAELLSKVFTAYRKPISNYLTGDIYRGYIHDGSRILDQVVVGCESDKRLVIHCHGNPILIQTIAELLTRHGGTLADAESFYAQTQPDTVWTEPALQAEAAIEQCKAAALEGVAIIQSQVRTGLSAWVQKTQADIESLSADDVHLDCLQILADSRVARRIIYGIKVVLTGPPNSGKSTLFNALAGSQKSVVSDVAGTTRDWVSAAVKIGGLRIELIDTAGLGEHAQYEKPDKAAQELTHKLLMDCDGIIAIENVLAPVSMAGSLPADKPVILVLNKADLVKTDTPAAPNAVLVSAKTGHNMDKLQTAIGRCFGADGFDTSKPAAFTDRQRRIIETMSSCSAKQEIIVLLDQLLYG